MMGQLNAVKGRLKHGSPVHIKNPSLLLIALLKGEGYLVEQEARDTYVVWPKPEDLPSIGVE
jgi:hypothetical protein